MIKYFTDIIVNSILNQTLNELKKDGNVQASALFQDYLKQIDRLA